MNSRDEHKSCWGLRPQGRENQFKEEDGEDLLEVEAGQGGAGGGTDVAGSACLAGGVPLEGRCFRSGFGLALHLKRSLSLQLFLFLGLLILANDFFFVGCAHGQA